MQLAYKKYCCFWREWQSRARSSQYVVRDWPHPKQFLPRKKNIANGPLVDTHKIFIPLLHVKLGPMKYFIKVVNRNGEGFQYLIQKLTWISDASVIK
jgi:hypothetical protein